MSYYTNLLIYSFDFLDFPPPRVCVKCVIIGACVPHTEHVDIRGQSLMLVLPSTLFESFPGFPSHLVTGALGSQTCAPVSDLV